jgi:DnaK suppressor protein
METLTKEILAELKEKLLGEKANLEKELENFAKKTGKNEFETKYNNIGEDEDENASEVEEYTDNLALENTLEGRLNEVVEALNKMEKGQYGICENCSKLISLERLRVYPAAKTCIDCSKN